MENGMTERITAQEFLVKADLLPVVDVRSPKEFLKGHVPGALNIPLFDNEERAVVGTLYKHSGRDASVLRGLEMAGPKITSYVNTAHSLIPGHDLLMYCWRGGMRSESMAWLLDLAGYHVSVLEGGYKAYRRRIRTGFEKPVQAVILSGLTGSGKTRILEHLASIGEQTLDLERIAHHKGSVFGGLGESPQPTNEQFENDLYVEFEKLDPMRSVWIEDESRMIGNITVPGPFFEKISRSVLIRIKVNDAYRVSRLVEGYAGFHREDLREALMKIAEKLGGTRTSQALDALETGKFSRVAELVLQHYDRAYEHAIRKRKGKTVYLLELEGDDPAHHARQVLDFWTPISQST
jgi:tRNA 2-selenouridine synthase